MRNTLVLVGICAVLFGCFDNSFEGPSSPPSDQGGSLIDVAAGQKRVEKDDMNDRFAIQTFDPPATGHVMTNLVQRGSISIQSVVARNLGPGDYGVVVTVGKLADGCDPDTFDPQAVVESPPMTANAAGILVLNRFFAGNFPPGEYRVDILVVPAGTGIGGDFLLACEPFPCVTVE